MASKKSGGFLTPKAISNRIKAKGMQKLRWYCQMCQKQCRDENGFKCHTMSEAHQRQLLLVAENPDMYIGGFSNEFLKDFMWLLSRSYGTRRVHANEVYQEYIKDRNHYHMNATRWETLTGFVCFLGKKGLCEVENTEKGWFIKYIDRSPEALAREAAIAKKDKMDKDDGERQQRMIEQQIARAMAAKGDVDDEVTNYTELQRASEEEKVVFSLKPNGTSVGEATSEVVPESNDASHDINSSSDEDSSVYEIPGEGFVRSKPLQPDIQSLPNALGPSSKQSSGSKSSRTSREGSVRSERGTKVGQKRKLTALEEIRQREEEQKEKRNRRENWITQGIVVKVVNKKLGDRFYKKKGLVCEVVDLFTGVVKMIETGDKIKIDQAHLETVIPAIGKAVMVVNGAYRGHKAILESLDTKKFCVSVQIDQGPTRGRIVDRVPYEDISKLA